jgi:hypothetical protein
LVGKIDVPRRQTYANGAVPAAPTVKFSGCPETTVNVAGKAVPIVGGIRVLNAAPALTTSPTAFVTRTSYVPISATCAAATVNDGNVAPEIAVPFLRH